MTPSDKYRLLVDRLSAPIISGARQPGANNLDGLACACDVAAHVLLTLFETHDERLVALDVFITRLGNVMDRDATKPN